MKSCVICYKPTSAVLITLNQKDWFYVCDIHLKDKHFAQLVYCDNDGKDCTSSYTKLKTIVEEKTKRLNTLKRIEEEKSQPGWLDKVWKTTNKNAEQEKKDESDAAPKETISDLEAECSLAKINLTQFERSNIKYKLDSVFYKGRLMKDYKRQKEKAVMQQMEQGTLFPSTIALDELNK